MPRILPQIPRSGFVLEPEAAYQRGLADLGVLADLIPERAFIHGAKPTSVDAAVYGFIANIHFYDIDTPLKQFVSARPNLLHHCVTLHEVVMRAPAGEARR